MSQVVALIGCGAMGGAIGMRLVATGTRLNVYDPNAEKICRRQQDVGKGKSRNLGR